MARLYIDGDEVRITKRDFCCVDVEFYSGQKLEKLEPRRLFPVSGLTKYITLLDENGKEQAIIRNVDALMPDSKNVIKECLQEYYLVPKILKLIDINEKLGMLKWTVETDRGTVELEHAVFRNAEKRNQLYIPMDAVKLFDMRWAYAKRNNFILVEHESEEKPISVQP